MTSAISRSRASTLKDPGPEVGELQSQLQVLGEDNLVAGNEKTLEHIHQKLEAGHRIRQSLLEGSGTRHIKDTFRHIDGFQIIIDTLEFVSQIYGKQMGHSEEGILILSSLLQVIFSVLSAALQDHHGNQRFFRQRVDKGGWQAMKMAMQILLSGEEGNNNECSRVLTERVFGYLLACALDDESMTGFFSVLTRQLDSVIDPPRPLPESLALVKNLLKKELGHLSIVHNPDAVLVMFDIWKALEDQAPPASDPHHHMAISFGIPIVVNYIAALSTGNLASLHGTGLLNVILTSLQGCSTDHSSTPELRILAKTLLSFGVASMDDAHFLFRYAPSSPLIAELLLSSLKSSRSPSFVHFDLSLNGYASIELPNIGRTFPPVSSSTGYTLCLWFQIIHFDPNAHTTIFGTFDASQTCFVLVYLEKDTHNIILQTSVTSSRPSVRFKSTSFNEGRWYHVVIAHRRPKTTSSARASLFIDGEFFEQVKSQYPAAPPSTNGGEEGSSSSSSHRRSNAIQAFLGTPQDLATQLGKGLVHTQWRLGLASLFAEVLSDDLIAVYHELGPRYTGNYQDCLGSFQTYQASAALNLRNESLHPGREEKSDIVSAIRSKAGALLPESKILLNISAMVVLDDNDQNNIDETHLLKSVSKTAGKNLRNVTRGGRNALAINGAIPSINEALLHSSGFAVLTGDPTVVVPQSLDDAAWRVGGCAAVCLALLEAAHGPDDINRALRILFASVKDNWRNSEAMERENGFGVLSTLLDTKLRSSERSNDKSSTSTKTYASTNNTESYLALTTLAEILKFLGYRADKPEDSVINNPLAYRILLVDMEFWRGAEPSVQKLYYEQFIIFGLRSKYHHFNTKRLSRMRKSFLHKIGDLFNVVLGITKKWLEALKGSAFTAQTFGYFLEAFKSFLTSNLSADSMRSLSLYITYAIHKPKSRLSLPAQGKSIRLKTDLASRRKTLGSSSPRPAVEPDDSIPKLTQSQVALKVLELYANLLCDKNDTANIKRFARTVTNKVALCLKLMSDLY